MWVIQSRKEANTIKSIFKLTQIQQIWPYEGGPTTSLTLPHIVKNMLTSPEHLKLSYLAMQPLMAKALVQDYERPGNLKVLLEQQVKHLDYLTAQQQDDLVWDTLAYYATRGASPEGYANSLASDQTLNSFSLHYELVNLMHVFDSKKSSGENLFSMPLIQKNSCIVGKPYHFWMSAYLSRYLLGQGIEAKQAFLSAALVGVLYDFMGSGAPQRERIRIYQEPLESIFTKSIQQSLLYKVVGAYYGVTQGAKLELDLDELYRIIKINQTKTDRRVYKTSLTHMKNLKNFLDHTAIDLIISKLANQL